jgi:sigma-B regulation protein RsbU (phosphoserine phosphatase)
MRGRGPNFEYKYDLAYRKSFAARLSFRIMGIVAGKGVPASLYLAVTRTLFRNLAGNYQSAANIVRETSHTIASTNDSYIFATVFVGVLDMKTHYLTYCNAAHNAP